MHHLHCLREKANRPPDKKMQQIEPREASPELAQSGSGVGRSRYCGFRDFADATDEWITTSRFGKLFRLSGSGHVSDFTIA